MEEMSSDPPGPCCADENRQTLRVLFVGSGAVNFGGAEGPWDHAKRLETLGGVKIVAIADPLLEKAKRVLKKKLEGPYADLYKDCITVKSFLDAISLTEPDVAFIGVPPIYHGAPNSPLDIELQCVKAGIHIFVEKPVSVIPPEKFVPYMEAVEKIAEEKKLIVSIGYMFRYHPAIEQMQSIIKQHGKELVHINARYLATGSAIDHPFWWDKKKSGGPIVEQATHFCDLLRYFGGDVVSRSISAVAVHPSDAPTSPGYLSTVPEVVKESSIPIEHRVPRVTTAHWLYPSGAIGVLTHGVTLHGRKYEAAIDVWADGLRLALEDPYFSGCKLRVRRGNTDDDEVYEFSDADPYLKEDAIFLRAVQTGDRSLIRSSYRDAAKTYQFSWDIRRASED